MFGHLYFINSCCTFIFYQFDFFLATRATRFRRKEKTRGALGTRMRKTMLEIIWQMNILLKQSLAHIACATATALLHEIIRKTITDNYNVNPGTNEDENCYRLESSNSCSHLAWKSCALSNSCALSATLMRSQQLSCALSNFHAL